MSQGARPRYQRARRAAEKAERREAILAAAGALLRSTGFEGFSMSVLARKTGIAKGTLYLYFETREEVLLALYVELLSDWVARFGAGLRDGMSDAAFVALFQRTAASDPNFLTLRARLESVIEHNVSLPRLVEAKRTMRDLLGKLSPRVEHTLGLAAGTGARLIVALAALQLGAAQSSMSPAVDGLALPDDVAEFMRLHAETDAFLENAPYLVAGIRREGGERSVR